MAFCSNCGQKLEDGAKFCSGCGTPVAGAEQSAQQPNTPPQPEAQTYTSVEDPFRQFAKSDDKTAEFDPMDIKNNKAIAILSYIGIFVLIPIFGAKHSKFARFHANQGLFLLILSVAYSIITAVIRRVFLWISWPLYQIFSALFPLLGLAFLALAIIGIVNAANGKAKELPVIGKLRILSY